MVDDGPLSRPVNVLGWNGTPDKPCRWRRNLRPVGFALADILRFFVTTFVCLPRTRLQIYPFPRRCDHRRAAKRLRRIAFLSCSLAENLPVIKIIQRCS